MKRISGWAVAAALASLILAVETAAWAERADAATTIPCDFVVANLGALPGDYAGSASGINNAGTVVGYSITFDPTNFDPEHPVMFQNRTVLLLHTLPSDGPPGLDFGAAVAINDQPVAVGTVFNPQGPSHAARFVGSGTTDLGTLPFGGNSYATSINNLGEIVGYAEAVAGQNGILSHAVHYAGGAVTDLGVLPGGSYSFAASINDQGVAVGYASTASGAFHAVRFDAGGIVDFGVPRGGAESRALAINSQGLAVGAADFGSGVDHAASFEPGQITDLGILPGGTTSIATAINNSGHAVGWADNGTGVFRPVLFAQGQVFDLGVPTGIKSAFPAAINDLDQVVGTVNVASSPISDVQQTLAASWTPTASCPLSVAAAQLR